MFLRGKSRGLFLLSSLAISAIAGGFLIRFLFSSASVDTVKIREQADFILSSQHPSGALTMTPPAYPNDPTASPLWVNPYFANYMGVSLINAYQVTGDRKYLDATKKYLNWYIGHVNQDGTIYDYEGNWSSFASKGTYDSTDSYAATFLILVNKYSTVSRDWNWPKLNLASLMKVSGAMDKTMDGADGLTYAKPDYKVKFLMDNNEVRLGLISGSQLARALKVKYPTFSSTYFDSRTVLVRNSLKNYYSGSAYSWAKYENGSYESFGSEWGTSGKANAMMLSYGLSVDEANKFLAKKIYSDFYLGKSIGDPRDYFLIVSMLNKFGMITDGSDINEAIYQKIKADPASYNHFRAFYIINSLSDYNKELFLNNLI